MNGEWSATVTRLEAELVAARARNARFEDLLARQRARRDLTREMLRAGDDARPLALGPLLSSAVATFGALVAALCAYATMIGADAVWTTSGLAACVVALLACSFARLPGAGGAARTKLGRFAFALTLFSAVFLMLGAAMTHAIR